MKLYKCADPACPGRPYKASDRPHPPNCGDWAARAAMAVVIADPWTTRAIRAVEAVERQIGADPGLARVRRYLTRRFVLRCVPNFEE